jgi:hypothetical protein
LRGGFRLVVLALALSLTGCESLQKLSEERYSQNVAMGHAWISDQILPAAIDISGTWKSRDWGDTVLTQTGRTVKGYVGDYPVDGVVSGQKAYLLASDGGWYRYSIVLEMLSPNVLIGYYSRSIPYQSSNRRDIRLDRTGRQRMTGATKISPR